MNLLAFHGLLRLNLSQISPRFCNLLALFAPAKHGQRNTYANRYKIASFHWIIGRKHALAIPQTHRHIRPQISSRHLNLCLPHQNRLIHCLQRWMPLISLRLQNINRQRHARKTNRIWWHAQRTLHRPIQHQIQTRLCQLFLSPKRNQLCIQCRQRNLSFQHILLQTLSNGVFRAGSANQVLQQHPILFHNRNSTGHISQIKKRLLDRIGNCQFAVAQQPCNRI